jgi:non-specific protein-tyrosine kinase
MELIQYIRLFRKWLWLILVSAFVGGGLSFIINTGRPPVYEAKSTLAIGRFIEARNPDQSDIRVGIDLAATYAQIVQTFSIMQGVIDALDIDTTPEDLADTIETRVIPNTSLLEIYVSYPDAILSADIANAVADQLVTESPTNLTRDQQAQLDFATGEITALNGQLQDARTRLTNIDNQIQDAETEEEIARLNDQRNNTITQINQASATIAQFTETITTLQQNTNALDIVERARIPTTPRGSGILVTTLLGVAIGVALALTIILLIEYLDESFRSTEDIPKVLGLPVLGAVMKYGKRGESYNARLVSQLSAMSPVSEAYRTIRTNLLFTAQEDKKGVYLVTSPGPEEGKSMTSANLAVTMALAGLQVLLIDCDLRRPKVHEIFGLSNEVGLTTLLSADPRAHDDPEMPTPSDRLPMNLLECLQTTALPKLWVITSGFVPVNPAELLGSTLMKRWVDVFRASSDIDVILIDTPPSLMAADSTVLAASTGAEVVLVLDSGHTRRRAALKVKEQFEQLGIQLKGVVLNRVSARDHSYEYGYGYYSYGPVEASNGAKAPEERRGLLRRKP